MNRTWKQIGSLFLSVCMVVTMLPVTAFAETGTKDSGSPLGASGEITAFAALDEDIAVQTEDIGTAKDDLNLPKTLKVTVTKTVTITTGSAVTATVSENDTATGSEAQKQEQQEEAKEITEETTVDVSDWVCGTPYDGDTEGDYVFTPALDLPDGLILAEGVSAPVIAVTVAKTAAPAEEAPAARGAAVPQSTGEDIAIDEANFPDKNFRDYLLAQTYGTDAILKAEEIASITGIGVLDKGITDLTGIEYFTAITYLRCGKNKLTELDVSKNTELISLTCFSNKLTELDVSNNTKLLELNVQENYLPNKSAIKGLDEARTTTFTFGNQKVDSITINHFNFPDEQFRSFLLNSSYVADGKLTVEAIANITVLDVSNKFITDLTGIEYFTELTNLNCSSNSLSRLDVSKNTKLTTLDARRNYFPNKSAITGLDEIRTTVTFAPQNLKVNAANFPDENFRSWLLSQSYGNDSTLTPEEIAEIKVIDVHSFVAAEKQISSLTGIEHFTELTELNCRNNQLTELDVSKNTKLSILYCDGNELTELNVSGHPALEKLDCAYNRLTALDVSKNTQLTELDCRSNELTELNVKQNTELTKLDCRSNELTELDVSQNTLLTRLVCGSNQLTGLDVSKNALLTWLYCDENLLTQLDVSKNTSLERLSCGPNQLTELDVSKNTQLAALFCSSNKLTVLDVSKNTKLSTLYVNLNYLPNQAAIKGLNSQTQLTFDLQKPSTPGKDVTSAFTDPNFRAAVRALLGRGSNEPIYDNEAARITYLGVNNESISSLAGIEYCTGLTELDGFLNAISELDLSKNTALERINCDAQEVPITLTRSGSSYTANITLNNPTLAEGLTYNNGILTSNSNTIASSPFTVATGHSNPNFKLSGTLNLTYVESGDITAPVLSGGSVNRASDTQAAIVFTTDEAGTAYYLVVNSGAAAPAAALIAAGTSLGSVSAGTVTDKAVTLTAGAKDIYVVVKDAAGNISSPLKIEAAAYAAPEATVSSIAVNSTIHKTAYKVGDMLDVTNLTIEASKSDGSKSTVPITADMVSGFNSTTAATSQTLTITYEGKTTTYTISIAKADGPAAPTGLTGVKPTTAGGSDGKITGTTALMEYSSNTSFTGATDCTGTEITGLAAGNYYVRVKATATHEAGAYAIVAVPEGAASPVTVTGVTVSPSTTSVQKGKTQTFTATVTGTGAFDTTVSWIVSGGAAGTQIDTSGKLTVDAGETAASLTVTATSNGDGTKAGTATVTVTEETVTKHILTVTNGTGDGSFAEGAKVTVTADAPDTGKEFDKWTSTVSGVLANETAPITIVTMPGGDVTVTATYKDKVVTPDTYSVDISGSYAATTGAGSYAQGTTVTIYAGNRSGYSFTGWTASGVTLANSSNASTTFTMPANAVTLTANWSYNGGGGGNGGGSSSGGSSSSTTTPATTTPGKAPNQPITAAAPVTATAGQNGTANASIPEKSVTDAIAKAQADAKAQGKTTNGTTVALNVTMPKGTTALTATLTKQSLDSLVSAGVTSLELNGSPVTVSFDTKALAEIQKQSSGNISITIAPNAKLSATAKTMIGTRPVYDLTVNYTKDGKNGTVSSFGGGTATVSVPYTPAKGEAIDGLYAVYVDASGNATRIAGSAYDANSGCVMFTTTHFSLYGIGYTAPSAKFTDITTHWAKESIDYVVGRGLLSGTTETTFAPDTAMTRGMLVTALGRLAGVDTKAYATNSFTDVKADSAFRPYIEWAYKKGVVQGTGNGKFEPDRAITREEIAVVFANFAKATGYTLPVTRNATTYADASSIGSTYQTAVTAMQQAGIMMGGTSNKFNLKSSATRAEVSSLLHRYIKLTIDPATAQGWAKNDAGQYLYYKDGKALTGTQTINGVKYFFNTDGTLKTGWVKDDTGNWRFYSGNTMLVGFWDLGANGNNKTYYFTKDGIMVAGKWLEVDGKWYYLNADGTLARSTKIDDYEVDEKGVRKTK
ncbi:S-layer homology domain-containing protein [Lachnospiraceae bacterium MD1]|uniref:S-layer homology domain-containing protein n=1 Tax=Variimorphobacter saccharofermentans TaxID=2755051 RepID=A0A839K306_9FIRM|nr:S-layer homology domain-containing protein [Variimorphobacter saccharofermentans]MBB2183572.1 S-layer homology domain-containing protein [Variimorphobacter saccharofermentans]